MLTRRQLREFHTENVPLHVLELDYIQSLVLKGIYARQNGVAFKGGTCLRKVFGLDRYSEDLDFNLLTGKPEKMLGDGVRGLKIAGIESSLACLKKRKSVYLATIRYQGPLYTGSRISEGSMRIEIAEQKPRLAPEWRTIVSPFPDAGTYSVLSMAPEELLAEKLRALVQRRKARDIYDTWFLLKRGVTVRQDLLDSKFDELGMDPRRITDILKGYGLTEKEWERDMKNLVARAPTMAPMMEYVEKRLRGDIG
ncbi:MAG: nucleotidyl transferase AbiEii/AbiGii toxin family protein [Candidatus Thermoplasmatota archaeon]